ncbi:MAG: hypothetical protein KDD89_15305, partial [Anaerolineales bacterium]|nr:hypothetical protein [Anaerolineales bacterium]
MIGAPNVERFPEVTQLVRAIDQNNNALLSLVDSQIKVFENGQRIESHRVTPGERTPAYVVFVIDQGQYFNPGSRRDDIQQAMRQWVEEGHFREDFDTVAILSREVVSGDDQTVELLPPTQSPTAFLNEVNQLTLNNSSERTDGLAGVEDGLALLQQLVREDGTASTAVVYIGSIIENDAGQDRAESEALAVASNARTQNTNIHVLDSDAGHRFSEPMKNLSNNSGGIYIPISSGNSNARSIYQSIIDQAQTHIVSYNSNYDAQIDNPGARNIAIAPLNVPVDAVESVSAYTISPQPPSVRINAPQADEVISRNPTSASADSYEVTTTDIEAEIDWSGNIAPREIVEAELVINGETVSPEDTPEVINNRLKLSWDLSGIVDERNTYRLQVRVRDALGFEATSTAVQVTVNAQLPLPPTAIPPTPTPPPLPPQNDAPDTT